MTPNELSNVILQAINQAISQGAIGLDATQLPAVIHLERPKSKDHGDWATNIAMQLGKKAGLNPREFATKIIEFFPADSGVEKIDIAGPGFLNFTLAAQSAGELARTIVSEGSSYGQNNVLEGEIINLEYVSANPTGPLHIGHTRWAAVGDALVRLLRASGAEVKAEYYINDAGAQMDKFGGSVLARATGGEVPEGGYRGEYVTELAQKVLAERPDLAELPASEALVVARELGYKYQLAEIQQVLADFQVHFDIWFSERDLHDGGFVEQAVAKLSEQGHVYEKDGAIWLRTTTFGDDKDRVMIKADGDKTYFAADAAYYLSKKERGFARKIYLLGADHHGYINRLKAIASCAGDDPEANIEILIGQLVSVGGAKLSKRAGNIIELKDLIEWIGSDAVRYSLARFPTDTPLSLNGDDLRKKSNDNPVFYVQYAHARTASVARNAAGSGVSRESGFDPGLLRHETESALLGALMEYPRIVAKAAQLREPHRVARFLEELAGLYHRWYSECRVTPIAESPAELVHHSRLWLNDATGVVLANGLGLLGVSAPEKM